MQAKRKAESLRLLGNVLGRMIAKEGAPCTVTLVDVRPRKKLDDDNIRSAFKSIRDGIADAFGLDDGHNSPIKFDYQQLTGPYGIRVVHARSNPTVPA